MPACSFCKHEYPIYKGVTVVLKDGSVRRFCSSKCRRNFSMGRHPRKVLWIQKSEIIRKEKEKRSH